MKELLDEDFLVFFGHRTGILLHFYRLQYNFFFFYYLQDLNVFGSCNLSFSFQKTQGVLLNMLRN